ncbi:hypothetical protein AVEN_254894-1 [Araneus ventricosus]|uniref:Carboxypeptidase activation peptide domain-containing protein n=1 Tax=Araneus ventricosus TaxID=182803 RepID=A0A4Y2F8B6_ARAVE|nr:hypothetical protein AVEN_254894-1 [Araneus ventricosus]
MYLIPVQFCIICIALVSRTYAFQNFTGHRLIGMTPRNEAEVKVLRDFMEDPEIDFWQEPTQKLKYELFS